MDNVSFQVGWAADKNSRAPQWLPDVHQNALGGQASKGDT